MVAAQGKQSTKKSTKQTRRKLPRCRACDKAIRIPKGWSSGAAVRRHYWRNHREVMLPDERDQ